MAIYNWRIVFLITLICAAHAVVSAQESDKYIVFFKDKAGSTFTLDEPAGFLSSQALERRTKYNIDAMENDLPVSPGYIAALEESGYIVLGQSRWLNAVLVVTDDDMAESDLAQHSFVRKVIWAATETRGGRMDLGSAGHVEECLYDFNAGRGIRDEVFWESGRETSYGFSGGQVRMLNGQFLHNNGWQGQDMTIAVLDAGFTGADEMEAFYQLQFDERIVDTYDFVNYDSDVYGVSGHGTSVLSTMAGRLDDLYLGTAPEAAYILLQTEDIHSEQLVEEFNYVLGLERAEQKGADIVNTSLGYTRYIHSEMDHTADHLDGDHLIASLGGDIAASKGLIVINSAGNEGNSDWQYISIPADGDSILAVGSVNSHGMRSVFSGKGWPGSGAVKPNIMAQGEGTAVINTNGEIVLSSGTSFSAPIIAGLTACLWQAFPERSNMEILSAIEQSGSQYLQPDLLNGYGLPDFQAAYALLYQRKNDIFPAAEISVFPNPFSSNITLTLPGPPDQDMIIHLVNDMGQVLFERHLDSGNRKTVNLYFTGVQGLLSGLYFLKIKTAEEVYVFKLIKV
jgi:subtilisin family serine protease